MGRCRADDLSETFINMPANPTGFRERVSSERIFDVRTVRSRGLYGATMQTGKAPPREVALC